MRDPADPSTPRGGLALVVLDDALLATQALPLARALAASGRPVAVVAAGAAHRDVIEAAGARAAMLPVEAGGLNPMTAGYAAGQLAAMLRALEPRIVHCLGLRAVVLGGTAAAMAGRPERVFALPDLGGLAARPGLTGTAWRTALRLGLRGALAGRGTRFLLASDADARALGLDPLDAAVRIADAGGAVEAALAIHAELDAGRA